MKKAKVSRIVAETPSAISVYLKPEEKEVYKPGQFITLVHPLNGEVVKRSYSFSSVPKEEEWRITVKKVGGGKLSNYLHKNLEVGQDVVFEGPEGRFQFDTAPRFDQHVLIAAGSGITPIMSMLSTAMEENSTPLTLFYGNRNIKETIFLDQLNEWQDRFEHFDFRLFLSKPGLKQILFSNKQPYFKGRITSEHLKEWLKSKSWDLNRTAFYICGPGEMNSDFRLVLGGLGVPEDNIKMEYFTAVDVDETISGESEVTFNLEGEERSVMVHRGQAILDGLLEAGYDPPYSCTSGTCCTCMAHLSSGEVHMERCDALSKREQKQGFILTCQARPVTDKVEITYDLD
ncbi:MAG: FAD-binding oxidoreductase [Saprospiraceae bacterium]|nr:FAD-binding oxidoreductase [Saprospiraceae bacterium]